jgi:hypothetical protein
MSKYTFLTLKGLLLVSCWQGDNEQESVLVVVMMKE